MGFFSDLKEDLSQAVNELIPEEETNTTQKEQKDDVAVSLDEMLANIDEINVLQDDTVELPKEDVADEDNDLVKDEVNTEADVKVKDSDEKETDEWNLESMLERAITSEPEEIKKDNDTKVDKGANEEMDNNSGRIALDETSIITAGMTVTGDIASEGSLDIVGKVLGNIDVYGKLNITGKIEGNSKAAEIYAEGAKINGEVVSEGAVKIGASTVIVGNITATSAAIAGAVKGDIDVKGPVILDASAIVMGNIKSKSVQINNGAVIEGMCSQCYADVNPTSFFEDYKMETRKSK